MAKTVFARYELMLTTTEDDKLVDLSDSWGTIVPVHAFPAEMQESLKQRAEMDDFSIDVMDF